MELEKSVKMPLIKLLMISGDIQIFNLISFIKYILNFKIKYTGGKK